jgi:hypothetical protein
MDAHSPAPYEETEVHAIRACIAGTANDGQQKLAMDWIIRKASNAYDVSYRPGDGLATAFAEGRRFVGLQIIKLLQPEVTAAVEARKTRGKRGKPE